MYLNVLKKWWRNWRTKPLLVCCGPHGISDQFWNSLVSKHNILNMTGVMWTFYTEKTIRIQSSLLWGEEKDLIFISDRVPIKGMPGTMRNEFEPIK